MKKITLISKCLLIIAGLLFAQSVISQNSWNTAAVYDGSSYYATLNNAVNSTTGEMTVEFWTKINTSEGYYALIGKDQFRIMTNENKIRVQANGLTVLYSKAKLDSSQWTHVAVTFSDANNAVKIYLNGTLDNSLTTFNGVFAATADSLIIGKNVYADNLEGELDEVRIWKTVRTSTEIKNNYKLHIGWYGFSNYDSYLIFCQTYEFDVYSPGIYFPYGGNHGVIGGDVLGHKPSNTVMHNNSMYFTGSSYVESSSAHDPDVGLSGTMTVEAWIYPTSIGTKQTILDLTQGGIGGYTLELESSGKISWTMTGNKGTGISILTANRWYHIAVVCETPSGGYQVARIYINGIFDNGFNYLELEVNTGKLRIGVSSSTASYFSGFMDEIRISNFVKTSAEIRQYLHTPILNHNKPAAPNITVAYNFDGHLYSGTSLINSQTQN